MNKPGRNLPFVLMRRIHGAAWFLVVVSVIASATSPPARLTLPPGMVVRGSVGAEELLAGAQQLLPKGAFLGPLLDARYAVIDHRWLEREFMPAYRVATEELFAIAAETGDASDCDSFGLFLRQMIGLAGVIGRTEEPAAAQMIVLQDAAFSGVERTRENHSVGLVLTERGWFVLEPQNAVELIPFEHYPNRRNLRYLTFH